MSAAAWAIWGLLTRLRRVCPANAHSLLISRQRRSPFTDSACRSDAARNGACWCGRLRTSQERAEDGS